MYADICLFLLIMCVHVLEFNVLLDILFIFIINSIVAKYFVLVLRNILGFWLLELS